jgi:hypothetical protein
VHCTENSSLLVAVATACTVFGLGDRGNMGRTDEVESKCFFNAIISFRIVFVVWQD